MKFSSIINVFLLIFTIIFLTNSIILNCQTQNVLTGCIQCANITTYSLVLNTSSNKYICSTVQNCSIVDSAGTCQQCPPGFILTIDSSNSSIRYCNTSSVIKPNCLIFNSVSNVCQQCYPNYILFNGSCLNNSIKYCASYSTASNCSKCMYNYMDPSQGCIINSTICTNFDYTAWKCLTCPLNTVLDQTGLYCVPKIQNCLIYYYLGCMKCEQQFILLQDNTTSMYSCQFTPDVSYQLLIQDNKTLCLKQNFLYPNSIVNCSITNSTINYCSLDDKNGSCTTCINGYYLKTGQCYLCSNSIENCLLCSSSLYCIACLPQYFLFNQTITNGTVTGISCRPCSVYGCKKCGNLNSSIACFQCNRGYTLYNNSCYQCGSTSTGNQLSILTLECGNCSDVNCQFCSKGVCTWCNQNYIVNSTGVCSLINQTLSAQLSSSSVYELIAKAFPNQQNLIYKNSVKLMSSCQQSSNLYSCLCTSISGVTSLCYNISLNTTISKFDFKTVFGNTIITGDTFLKNSQTLRLMAQLPAFDDLVLDIQQSTLIPQRKIASLLQIYTQILRRKSIAPIAATSHQKSSGRLLMTTNETLTQLYNLIQNSLSLTLSLTQTTVIYGNGYYFKYYPTVPLNTSSYTVTDTDSSFVSLPTRAAGSKWMCVFIWFQNLISSKSLTGNIYVFSPTTSQSQLLTIKQLQFPSFSYNYKTFQNNQDVSSTSNVTKLSSNFLTINVMTSNPTNIQSFLQYDVQYIQNAATDLNSLYSNQRIQFIFYQPAFIYVLVFLIAYLFLIPYCSIVDMIQNKQGHRRKRIRSEDLTMSEQAKKQYQQKQRDRDQQSSEPSIIISVNYKDFFPIYNICNTPRPRRILKLCLFLLNVQHSITFLTLIYFNLAPGHPVLAVVLGLPAYFCTVIMGYICGFLTIVIPGVFKYLINLITLGYWILWIALMPQFLSTQYQPYVFIFAIVFFIIDILVDLLQTFLVYFTIKQSQRQIKMFQCLATWLSKRGFYQYDKLAKQLDEAG